MTTTVKRRSGRYPTPDRIDARPEETVYVDDWCGGACARSLECPFARCRYDAPMVYRRREAEERRVRILMLRRLGWSIDAIAVREGVSRRTVHRDLEASHAAR